MEKERERNINDVWLPLEHSQLGTWPTTQACTLTGNRTRYPWFTVQHSIHGATLNRAMYHIFIQPSIKGHSGCLQVLTTLNKAAMNTGVHIPLQINVFKLFGLLPCHLSHHTSDTGPSV